MAVFFSCEKSYEFSDFERGSGKNKKNTFHLTSPFFHYSIHIIYFCADNVNLYYYA